MEQWFCECLVVVVFCLLSLSANQSISKQLSK